MQLVMLSQSLDQQFYLATCIAERSLCMTQDQMFFCQEYVFDKRKIFFFRVVQAVEGVKLCTFGRGGVGQLTIVNSPVRTAVPCL